MSTHTTDIKEIQNLYEKNEFAKALECCNRFIDKHLNEPQGYRERSAVYRITKQFQEALEDITYAIALSPFDQPSDYCHRARIFLYMNQPEGAINDLTKAIELCHTLNSHYHMQQAYFFRAEAYLRLGKFEHVLEDCINIQDETRAYLRGRVIFKRDLIHDAQHGVIPEIDEKR